MGRNFKAKVLVIVVIKLALNLEIIMKGIIQRFPNNSKCYNLDTVFDTLFQNGWSSFVTKLDHFYGNWSWIIGWSSHYHFLSHQVCVYFSHFWFQNLFCLQHVLCRIMTLTPVFISHSMLAAMTAFIRFCYNVKFFNLPACSQNYVLLKNRNCISIIFMSPTNSRAINSKCTINICLMMFP